MHGLLDIESLARPEIEAILARSKDFQPAPKQPFKRFTTLQNRTIDNGETLRIAEHATPSLPQGSYVAVATLRSTNFPVQERVAFELR